MSATAYPLVQGLRAHAPALLDGVADPHDELLALVWGPRFDRTHALDLLARHGAVAPQHLSGVMDAADRYDGLGAAAQRRLRQLILRHRASRHATMAHHAPHPAD